jgi:hypothetical protein
VFVFGCFTAQRWSDINSFKKDQLKGTTWRFYSYKTRKLIELPLDGFMKPALIILQKHDFALPKISQQKFNDYLKELGKLCGINEVVHIQRFSGSKKIIIEKPKYEFMSSHMARRTAVTILLSKNVPLTTVRKITAHADIRTLMKYENTNLQMVNNELVRIGNLTISPLNK